MIEQVKGTRNLFGAESEKYIHIFKDHGMHNIREIKVKLIQFQRSE